jgi:hypothetical protein
MGTALRFPPVVLVGVAMVTGPGDELAASAPGRRRLGASHADREQVTGTLKTAFAQGSWPRTNSTFG